MAANITKISEVFNNAKDHKRTVFRNERNKKDMDKVISEYKE